MSWLIDICIIYAMMITIQCGLGWWYIWTVNKERKEEPKGDTWETWTAS